VGSSAPAWAINSHRPGFYSGWVVQDLVRARGTVDGLC
jgi:hypothetical protein